jgi:hypothetical protein
VINKKVGIVVTGFSGFASMNDPSLLKIFMLNPLHNIVHMLVGALLIVGGLASLTVWSVERLGQWSTG